MEIASLIVSYPLTEAGCVVDTRSNLIEKYFDDIRMMAIFHFSEDRTIRFSATFDRVFTEGLWVDSGKDSYVLAIQTFELHLRETSYQVPIDKKL